MANFLQNHYNQHRQAGGEHIEYVLENDLSEEVAAHLKATYEKTHPVPVSKERRAAYRRRIERETQEVERRCRMDTLYWLLGRGPYGQ